MSVYVMERSGGASYSGFVAERRAPEQEAGCGLDFGNARDIIMASIRKNEPVTVIGDYDCDGICASAILARAIVDAGAPAGNVRIRLPRRFSEGYGMNPSMIRSIDRGLVVTVDNGITSFGAAKLAAEKGLKLVITDHHRVKTRTEKVAAGGAWVEREVPDLPPAECIVDPQLASGPGFRDYCGAGIALRLSETLIGRNHPDIPAFTALAAVATVTDVVPVTGDNRNIVIDGMEAVRGRKADPGLYALFVRNGADPERIPAGIPAYLGLTDTTVGYYVGPCINAASRMNDDGALTALRCFITRDPVVAGKLADSLIENNIRRKEITDRESAEIDALIAREGMERDCPMVLYLPDCSPGIIGLHAGRLCERYRVPTVVICGRDRVAKGSCRSPEGADISGLLRSAGDIITYGGHSRAAGLSIEKDRIPELRSRLAEACRKNGITAPEDTERRVDFLAEERELPGILGDLSDRFAPFGEGNPNPRILAEICPENIRITEKHIFMKCGNGLTVSAFYTAGRGDHPPDLAEHRKCFVYGTLGCSFRDGRACPEFVAETFVLPDDTLKTEHGDMTVSRAFPELLSVPEQVICGER